VTFCIATLAFAAHVLIKIIKTPLIERIFANRPSISASEAGDAL
jgi:hypothetical protein